MPFAEAASFLFGHSQSGRHGGFGGLSAAPAHDPLAKKDEAPAWRCSKSFRAGLACPVQRWRRRRLSFMARGLLDRKISEALCFAAPGLGFDAAFAGREIRTGCYAKFRLFCRRRDQAK